MAPVRPHDALFRFVFGEPEQLAELLRGEPPPALADPTVRVLQCLRLRPAEDAAEDIARWRQLVVAVLSHPRGRDGPLAMFSWLAAGAPNREHTARTIMTVHANDPLERGLRVPIDAPLEGGMQQGLQQGVVAGLRELLAEQLRLRFGQAAPRRRGPPRRRRSVAAAVGAPVVTARTLADVFASA